MAEPVRWGKGDGGEAFIPRTPKQIAEQASRVFRADRVSALHVQLTGGLDITPIEALKLFRIELDIARDRIDLQIAAVDEIIEDSTS